MTPEIEAHPALNRRPENIGRKAAAAAVWAALETWGRQIIQLLLFVVLARLLGPEAYGLVGIATAITAVIDALIGSGGWSEALIQRRDLEPEHLDAVFWFGLAGTTALALLAAAAAGPIADLFGEPSLVSLIRWLSLTLPISAFALVPSALLRRELDFAPHAARAVLAPLVGGVVAVPMALHGLGAWSLVGLYLAQTTTTVVVLWRAYPWRPGFRFSPAHLRQLLPYVSNIMGDRIVGAVDTILPRFVIGYTLGTTPVGYYMAARRVLELLFQLVTVPLSRVAFPSFAAVGHDPERLRSMLWLGAQLAGLLAFPCYLGAAVVAPDLMPAVFGPGWAPSTDLFQVLALVGLVTPFSQLSAVLLQGVGRVGYQFALTFASTMLLALLLALAGSISLTAVALAMLIRAYLIFAVRLYVTRRATAIDVAEACRSALPTLVAAFAMAGAVLLWRRWLPAGTEVWVALGSSVAIGIVVYVGALALLVRPLLRRATRLALSLGR